LAGDYFGDGSEAKAVFVAEGEIAQEIAHGEDTASFESGGALRAYAVKIFDRIGKRNRHRVRRECITFISSVAVREARLRFVRRGKG
jgi:hypothetical protein